MSLSDSTRVAAVAALKAVLGKFAKSAALSPEETKIQLFMQAALKELTAKEGDNNASL